MRIPTLLIASVLVLGLGGCAASSELGSGIVDSVNSESDLIIKADLGNAKTAIIAFTTDQPGAFPTDISQLAKWGYAPAEGQQPVTLTGDATGFCIQGTAESGSVFTSRSRRASRTAPAPRVAAARRWSRAAPR